MDSHEVRIMMTLEYAIVEFMTSTLFLLILLFFSSLAIWKNKEECNKLWISLLGSGILTLLLKFLIQRPRPLMPEYFFANIPDYSFPSLHTALAFATIPFLWKASPKYKYFFLLLACILALTRVYFQKHYLSDVIAGAVVGIGVAYVIMNKIKNKDKR